MTGPTLDPPEDLPSSERALLAAYRREHRMPPAARARLAARLESGATATARLGPGASAPEHGPRSRAWVVAVALAAALLLAWGLGALRSESATEDDPDARSQAAMQGHDDAAERRATERTSDPAAARRRPGAAPSGALSPNADEPAPDLAPDPPKLDEATPSPVGSSTSASSPPTGATSASPASATSSRDGDRDGNRDGNRDRATDRRPGRQDRETPDDPSAQTPASPLVQERAILARAWAALARGAHADALATADEHARRFPSGVLGVERDAITTIARCKAKRPGWSKAAADYLAANGQTPLARRVREACAEP